MNILISGQHIKINAQAKDYMSTALKDSVSKYFHQNEEDLNIHVHLISSPGNGSIDCDISIANGLKRHKSVCGKATGENIYDAFNLALPKMMKQLIKYRGKINNHHKSKISQLGGDATQS